MSEYTPTIAQGCAAYCDGLAGTSRTRAESAAEFVLMIAEVERAAAEKAWDEGYSRGNAHNGRRDDCPYRREENNDA